MPGMSVRIVALLSIALTGGITAQDSGKIERLEQQNRALSKKLGEQTREIVALKAKIAAVDAARAKPVKDRPKAKAEVRIRAQRNVELAQRVNLVLRQQAVRNLHLFIAAESFNPLLSHANYTKALAKFNSVRASLGKTTDPVAARKIVDEMNRLLLDVRRALWEIEQKQKAAKKTAADEKKK